MNLLTMMSSLMNLTSKTTEYDNPWIFNNKPFTSEDIGDSAGFIYKITDKETGKFYIGKKTFVSKRKLPPLKGKSRKRIKLSESDWKDYYGSSEELSEDIGKYGKEQFSREILMLCRNKSEMTYFEAKYQFDMNVLTEENCYNKWIMCKVRRGHIR